MSQVHGRGRLTAADRERIYDLAGKGLKAPRIAQIIRRHPSTVNWFMYVAGLKVPTHSPNRPASYKRGNRVVHTYTPEEDAFIRALRVQDYSINQIADLASKRFGTARTYGTVRSRLVMLAAAEEAQ